MNVDRITLHKWLSVSVVLVLLSGSLPANLFDNEGLCRRHKNCGCLASECTCKDEEIHRYAVDECLISSHDCGAPMQNVFLPLRLEGVTILFTHAVIQVFLFHLEANQTFLKPSSAIADIFHPPDSSLRVL